MTNFSITRRLAGLGAALAVSAAAAPLVHAQSVFSAPQRLDGGQVSFASAERGRPVLAGGEVLATGRGFTPNQSVSLLYGQTRIGGATANAEGGFETRLTVPTGAASGNHPIVVVSDAPYNAEIANLKVSPTVPLSNEAAYSVTSVQPTRGLYQTAYGAKRNAVFATSAVGRPPVRQSELLRLNADTLAVEARITPAAAPGRTGRDGQPQDGGVYAVYGVGVDDAHDTVWVTNSRQNTVAVYRQSDLSLVRQFESGTVNHARDVVIDEQDGKAYASATFQPEIVVFDTAALSVSKRIKIETTVRGETFSAASLSYDRAADRLYVASNSTNEIAVINTQTDEVEHVYPAPGARSVIGVAHDAQTNRIFAAAQGTDNLVILNGADGSVIADTPVGAGALNVVFEPKSRRAFISAFGAGTVTVTDVDGRIVANLPAPPVANHVSTDGRGNIYAAVKSGWSSDGNDTVLRIRPVR
ncbi:YncE family protein [Brevundimonas sp. NPDC058933]|uniref:YncE family protein n=1 Tax=Brevundimonas sp. NPDC058933 TaxID=3346673 RepID=UPI003BEEC865